MSFIEVAKIDDVAEGTMKSFTVNGKEILVINYQGKYYAVAARCTHMNGELAKGKLEGKIVTCPRHGSKFDVTSGECISGPRIAFIKLKTANIAAYEVRIEGKAIMANI